MMDSAATTRPHFYQIVSRRGSRFHVNSVVQTITVVNARRVARYNASLYNAMTTVTARGAATEIRRAMQSI